MTDNNMALNGSVLVQNIKNVFNKTHQGIAEILGVSLRTIKRRHEYDDFRFNEVVAILHECGYHILILPDDNKALLNVLSNRPNKDKTIATILNSQEVVVDVRKKDSV